VKTSWETTKIDGNTMRLFVAQPDGAGPFPGVLVIQHRDGVDGFVEEMTKRVATAGYFAAAPDLYHRDAPDCKDDGATRMTRLRDANVIKDVKAAIDFLKGNPSVQAQKLGIVGFCMGGRVVCLTAPGNSDLKAAVSYYPGGMFASWGEGTPPIDRLKEMACPLLGHFGEDDKFPTLDEMRKIDAELTKHDKFHEFHTYANAGHAFMNFHGQGYRPKADEASWPRTVNFLNKYLGGRQG